MLFIWQIYLNFLLFLMLLFLLYFVLFNTYLILFKNSIRI